MPASRQETVIDVLVREEDFLAEVGLTRIAAWKIAERDPSFPKPIHQGRMLFRKRSEINAYKEALDAKAAALQAERLKRGAKRKAKQDATMEAFRRRKTMPAKRAA